MKVAIIFNRDMSGVINTFGIQNKETYNPATVQMVADALEKAGHNVRVIDGNMNVIEKLQEFMPRVIAGERMGMVFNMAYGIQGESRYTHIPSMLEMLGIPYVGSTPAGHALALDKVITKIIMQKYGISTPHFWVFSTGFDDMSDVEFPVIVKPKMEAVSFGLKIAHTREELEQAVKYIITEFQQQALVEQFIRGREFCVGLLGNGVPEAFPLLEIDLGGDPEGIQTVEDKRSNPRKKICPAEIPHEIAEKMIHMSRESFFRLGLRDFSRVDIRLDEDNNIYLLEINSMASLGKTGSYVKAAEKAGYNFQSLVNRMLDVASIRYFAQEFSFEKNGNETKELKPNPLPVRIRGFLRTRQNKTEKLLSEMVNINTHVRNVDGVNKLGSFVARQLSTLGFSVQVHPLVEAGNLLFFSNSDFESCDVLILGHIDNSVPFTRHRHFSSSEQRLGGTGIWENKSGLAVMIAAMQTLRFLKNLKQMKINIILTSDNSIQGKFSKSFVHKSASRASYVFGLSGSSPESTVITSRSGAAVYNCSMNLSGATASHEVSSAASRFAKLIQNITEITDEPEGIVVSPREVSIKTDIANQYAHGETSFSVRFNSKDHARIIDARIKELVKKHRKKGIELHLEGGIRRDPMLNTKKNEDFYMFIRNIADKLDIRLLREHRWSTSEICSAGTETPTIDGFGAVGALGSNRDEYILRHSLMDRAALLAMVIISIREFETR